MSSPEMSPETPGGLRCQPGGRPGRGGPDQGAVAAERGRRRVQPGDAVVQARLPASPAHPQCRLPLLRDQRFGHHGESDPARGGWFLRAGGCPLPVQRRSRWRRNSGDPSRGAAFRHEDPRCAPRGHRARSTSWCAERRGDWEQMQVSPTMAANSADRPEVSPACEALGTATPRRPTPGRVTHRQ